MKKRIVVLFVCLFALTPALMGSAWAREGQKFGNDPIFDDSRDCELLRAKRVASKVADVRTQTVVTQAVSGRASGQQAL